MDNRSEPSRTSINSTAVTLFYYFHCSEGGSFGTWRLCPVARIKLSYKHSSSFDCSAISSFRSVPYFPTMSESSSSPSIWNSSDDTRDMDPESEVACFLDRSEVSDFGPFRVDSILTLEDWEIISIKYQIPAEFRLEVVIFEEWIALSRQDRVGLYKESLKIDLQLSFYFFIVDFLNLYRINFCSITSNSWRQILSFFAHCHLFGVEPTSRLLRTCFYTEGASYRD